MDGFEDDVLMWDNTEENLAESDASEGKHTKKEEEE